MCLDVDLLSIYGYEKMALQSLWKFAFFHIVETIKISSQTDFTEPKTTNTVMEKISGNLDISCNQK